MTKIWIFVITNCLLVFLNKITWQRTPRWSGIVVWLRWAQSHSRKSEVKLLRSAARSAPVDRSPDAGPGFPEPGLPLRCFFLLCSRCSSWHSENSHCSGSKRGSLSAVSLFVPFDWCVLTLSCHFGLVSQIMVINANSQHELWAAQMLHNPRAGRVPSFYIA